MNSSLVTTTGSSNITQLDINETSTTGSVSVISNPSQPTPTVKQENWYIFSKSFLNLAELGCKELLSREELSAQDLELLIPIIYTIRHSIEIILKTLSVLLGDENTKVERIHKVDELIGKLKERPSTAKGLSPTKRKEWTSLIEELSPFIKEYTEYTFLLPYLSATNVRLEDTENTFLKYPENSARLHIDYANLITNLTTADIQKVHNDILKLKAIIIKGKSIYTS
jgi:predicted DNA-binding protein (UPF0251 family)